MGRYSFTSSALKWAAYCILSSLLCCPVFAAAEYPLIFTDATGKQFELKNPPDRIVSLAPSITEMLFGLGLADKVVGTTHHSLSPFETSSKTIVGGFSSPDMGMVSALQPDVIFYGSLHKKSIGGYEGDAQRIYLATNSRSKSEATLKLLGRMFNQEQGALRVLSEQQRQLDLIAQKVAKIPAEEKQRVMRIMGSGTLMTPGDDSFQQDYIRAAGGIPIELGKNGNVVSVDLEEWQKFNPQLLYGCGGDRSLLELLEQPGWREVDAVRNGNYRFYPCDLTCRTATNSGYFVSWLSADIYGKQYGEPVNQVLPDKVIKRKQLQVPFKYVKSAEVIESDIRDFRQKSLLVSFHSPMKVVSTLEGERENILQVGNHYFPPQTWGLGHNEGVDGLQKHTFKVLGLESLDTAFLFTGADMANLAMASKKYKDMEVIALATAGVGGNALRMAKDEGRYYEPGYDQDDTKPGTINILILTNMQLTPRAMTRALISATEGKSAAMQDLDIRSSYTGMVNPATGTGTDNIIVVEGAGQRIDAAGGHTKMGELIARAVYQAVQEAIYKQNRFSKERSIFQRLKERKTTVRKLTGSLENSGKISLQLERMLLDPAYSSFIESALSLSDSYERGLVKELGSFDLWCSAVASQLAGGEVVVAELDDDSIPLVLRKAFGALISGIQAKQ